MTFCIQDHNNKRCSVNIVKVNKLRTDDIVDVICQCETTAVD